MGSHVLDIGEAPTVDPAGASANDYQSISTNADMFGGGIGRAEQGLGGAVEGAGTTALGVLTEKAKLNNDLMVNDALTTGSQSMAAAAGDYFTNQQGKNAQAGLPAANAQFDQIRQKAVATMPSPEAQVALDNQLRRVQIHWTESAQNHADTQHKIWQQQSWTSGAANAGEQAVTLRSDPEKTDEWLNTSDVQIRNLGQDKGMDDDAINREVQQNRGRNVAHLVEETAVRGLGDGKPDVPLAKEYFEKYRDKMDAAKQIEVDNWIKAKTTQQQGDDEASADLRKAASDHGVSAVTRQPDANLNPDAEAPAAPSPRAFTPSLSGGAPTSVPTSGSAAPLPMFVQAAQSNPGGMSPTGMAKLVQIESGGRAGIVNGSGHAGLIQAGPAYWSRFGQGSPLDPNQAIAALGRSTASDATAFRAKLGRDPTDAELYIAHQQGLGGALALMRNPDLPAAQALVAGGAYKSLDTARIAVRANGGNPDAPAQAFVNMWTGKFTGAGMPSITPGGGQTMTMPPAFAGIGYRPFASATDPGAVSPEASAASAFMPAGDAAPTLQSSAPAPASLMDTRSVLASTPAQATDQPNPGNTPVVGMMAAAFAEINRKQDAGLLSPEVAQVARTRIHQRIEAQQVADESDSRGRKLANDDAANGYVSAMLKGDTNGLLDKIASDPRLTWETKRSLGDAIEKQTSDGSREAARHYGHGFFPALQAITASPDDPNRISDPSSLLSHVLPGGDLTLAGYEKLNQVFKENLRGPDPAAINGAKASLIAYAKSKLSFDQETSGIVGMTPLKDTRGAQIFNAQFIPRFEASYDQWIKAGKNPWDFLNQETVDKLRKGLRDPTEMAQSKIAAGDSAAGLGPSGDNATPQTTPPPPPPSIEGLNPDGWRSAVSQTPEITTSRGPVTREIWAKALTMLATNPTPKTVRFFNESPYGRAGLDGSALVKQLTGLDVQAELPPSSTVDSAVSSTSDPTGGVALGLRSAYPSDWRQGDSRILSAAPNVLGTSATKIVDAAGTLGEATADADLEAGAKFSVIGDAMASGAKGVARGVGSGIEMLKGLIPEPGAASPALAEIKKHRPKEDKR